MVLPECLPSKFDAFHRRTVKRIVKADAESPFSLFFSFSASFKNSSSREKVGKIVFVLALVTGVVGRVCLYSLLSRNKIFSPALTMAARAKKILAKRFSQAISVHYRDFKHAYVH